MGQIITFLRRLICIPIYIYRLFISPLMPARCRFYPSCSAYALEAILRFGVIKGGLKSLKRILKCHPWGPHGIDLVLPNHQKEKD